eukprot:430724-Amphidinium_carterae.1
MTAADFTRQDHYLVVVHTTDGLLRSLKENLETTTARQDMAGWYARKDNDQQYQIKAGAELERLGGDREGRSITIGEYMELNFAKGCLQASTQDSD